MGMASSRESGAQSPSTPTHNNAGELTSVLGGVAITTNVTPPATTVRRSGSTSKMIQQSWKTQENQHLRANSLRIRTARPMPDHNELNERFAKVLESMDLPPDKAKRLKNYDNKKKWEILCDQEAVSVKEPPSHYLTKLRTYLDPKASKSYRKRKIVGESTSSEVLRNLEISLRTNHIEWVKEFLDETNQGLDSLVDYLSLRLQMMRYDQRIEESHTESDEQLSSKNVTTLSSGSSDCKSNGYLRPSLEELIDSPNLKRRTRHVAKLNMGTSDVDIHVCIMCLRAIMNNKFGFNMVIQHREAINCIALSLLHKSLRTKALVLELLAAICLVKGGHEIILSAFDNFKNVCLETKRFQTLMNYFMFFEMFNIDFMVACMQFINIVVHSVENMNYRVHLQYEFTSLGLDEYLEKLKFTESLDLQIQIHAYLDNVFNVAALMEDSETKTAALERVQLLEEDLSRAWENERDNMYKIAELNSELQQLRNECDALSQMNRKADEEVSTLRKVLKQNELEIKNRDNLLETKQLELQNLTKSLPKGATIDSKFGDANVNNISNNGPVQVKVEPEPVKAPPPPPMPQKSVPPPPVPPPPPFMGGGNRPLISAPTPPGFMPNNVMTIKRQHLHKYKLPTINWIALKPNQVRGTIFNEMDDDKLHAHIDFVDFEENFKIGMAGIKSNGSSETDGLLKLPSQRIKKPENVSLLEHTRLRNIAISRRKLGMSIDAVAQGINMLDLKQISLENVEILQKMIPTEQEIKAYKEYIIEKKDPNLLTDEDKFIMHLAKIERISSKLAIMNYMGNFYDSVHLISPQIEAILNASHSMKSSKKFRSVLEIVLAFGNYLNSSKRGPAYGFKLQSLDTLLDTKSSDKRICLLHYIVMTIRQKFPHLMDFDTELFYIDKAAQVSLENVVTDVAELDKGMESVRKEADVRTKSPPNLVLKDFLTNSEDKLRKMKHDSKRAQDAFKECVEYFGESSRNTDANTFFSLLVRFVRSVKTADKENEQRRRLKQAAAQTAARKQTDEAVLRNNQINTKKQQEAVINELKSKSGNPPDKLCRDIYNGALEEIILGLKSEPYRRADAVRRSHRRRIDSHRMSRTADDVDV